ncbi:hypothetical protein U9M48_025576, partial [Paspalum notatum var. saurae]
PTVKPCNLNVPCEVSYLNSRNVLAKALPQFRALSD